jgi:methyltransferase (TIGR00027 family)
VKEGRASQTATIVCVARAAAHGRTTDPRFQDPVAIQLLSDDDRASVERLRNGEAARSTRENIVHETMKRRGEMMVVRTNFVDDVVRDTRAAQVVILGAGLDGRAWRMAELAEAIVFEVDHPDTQRDKRARTASLRPLAREVRFVSVDFTKDSLAEALAAAGHDPSVPTTWIWEGVVMYLRRAEIEATMKVIAARSAPSSALAIVYASRSPLYFLVGFLVRQLGEPFRSAFTAAQMAALLHSFGFDVALDEDVPTAAKRSTAAVQAAVKPMRHLRLVSATRSATARSS